MTTWFLFLSIGLLFAWTALWIGTSISNDSSSPLACATGLKHKDFSNESPLWNEIQCEYGKSLQKAGTISSAIFSIGMLCLLFVEQDVMIPLSNCLLGIEIVLVLLAYVQNLKLLNQKLQTNSTSLNQEKMPYEVVAEIPYEEDVPSIAQMDLERLEQFQDPSQEDSSQKDESDLDSH